MRRENSTARLNAHLAELMEQIQSLRAAAPGLAALMERAYEELRDFWGRRGLNATHYRLRRLEETGETEQGP